MKKWMMALAVLFFLVGCFKDSDAPQQQCTYNPCSFTAPDTEIQNVKKYLDSMGIMATQHCSGLFYKIDDSGTGAAPAACSLISVAYKGSLTNGTVFDQTGPGQAYTNYLPQFIRGWVNGIPLIKSGGKIHLYIPPSLGYGSQVVGTIPANSILLFEVNLLAVQ